MIWFLQLPECLSWHKRLDSHLNPQPSMALLNTTFPKSGEKYREESSVSSSPELQSSIDTATSSVTAFWLMSFSGTVFDVLFSRTSVVNSAAVMAFTLKNHK